MVNKFKKSRFSLAILLSLLCVFVNSCKDDEGTPEPQEDFVSDFYSNTTDLQIIVGYETGAEPYISYASRDAWAVCLDNIQNLLSSKDITVTVPTQLSEMEDFGTLEQNNYSRENILELAADIQNHTNKDTIKGITIIFLNGYYIKDGVILDQVLGLNIGNSSVVAIFKPVINAASSSKAEQTLVEQSTLTHEIGHAIGLVNNGVRATSAHHDEANGSHCTNTECVMYWMNGAGDISKFITPFLTGNDVDLFGSQCIADIKAK
jgi:predicted Zn-dependent protease